MKQALFQLFLIFAVICVCNAFAGLICVGACKHVVQPVLHCVGSIIKHGGYCGCTDVCARQEHETCNDYDRFNTLWCEPGLTCVHNHTGGYCTRTNTVVGRSVPETLTACQQKLHLRMLSMVVYRGMWTPKCDANGDFQPQQCDNIGRCFCVDTKTGKVDQTTMVQGPATCVGKTLTKCQEKYASMQFIFVIWEGMWTPKCDAAGNFEPEQCDNTGHCFCVSAVDGTVDESTKVLGRANCSNIQVSTSLL